MCITFQQHPICRVVQSFVQFLQHCNRKASKIHEDVKRCDSRLELNAGETIFREQNACLEWANDPRSLICGHS